MLKSLVPHKTKSELAIEAIRSAILRGDITPGSRLTLAELSELLSMSSTPIREAIRVLEGDGLVVCEAHKGVWVKELSDEEAGELALLRAAIEGLATRFAVPNLGPADLDRLEELQARMVVAVEQRDDETLTAANMEWHHHIYAASRTHFVGRHAARLWLPYHWRSIWTEERRNGSLVQHTAIMTALKAGDAEGAERLMYDHILFQTQATNDATGNESAPPRGVGAPALGAVR
jgi:DNA-binding GntR family transcriptional regulator